MTALVLRRTRGDRASTGVLSVLSSSFFTIEPPWLDDQPDVSCVPDGAYDLIPYQSPTHGDTWYLSNPGLGVGGSGEQRSYCELHSANWARQLKGCIALGLEGQPMMDPDTGQVEPAVENSRDAIAELLALLGPLTPGHTLTISSTTGGPPP